MDNARMRGEMREVGQGLDRLDKQMRQLDSSVSRSGAQAEKAGGMFRGMLKSFGGNVLANAASQAGHAIVQFGSEAFQAGLRAEEAANKFSSVFGPSMVEASRFVDEYAQKMGFADAELQAQLGTIGAVVQGLGVAQAESADVATRIAMLGADLASFHDTSVEDAIGAITSALTGEREALKRYGIVVREVDVAQLAMAESGKSQASALSDVERAMATMSVVSDRAGAAIGDFNKTSDQTVGSIRELTGQWEQLKVEVGQRLIPVFNELMPTLRNEIFPAIKELVPQVAELAIVTTKSLIPAFKAVVPPMIEIIEKAGGLAEAIHGVTESFAPKEQDKYSLEWWEQMEEKLAAVAIWVGGGHAIRERSAHKEDLEVLGARYEGLAENIETTGWWLGRTEKGMFDFATQTAYNNDAMAQFDEKIGRANEGIEGHYDAIARTLAPLEEYVVLNTDLKESYDNLVNPVWDAIAAVEAHEAALRAWQEPGGDTIENLKELERTNRNAEAAFLALGDGDIESAMWAIAVATNQPIEKVRELIEDTDFYKRMDKRGGEITIDVQGALNHINSVVAGLDSIDNRHTRSTHTHTVTVNGVTSWVSGGGVAGGNTGVQLPNVPTYTPPPPAIDWFGVDVPGVFGYGGISYSGTGSYGGYALVGEYGPELVKLPYGTQIYSTDQTVEMVASGSVPEVPWVDPNYAWDTTNWDIIAEANRDWGGLDEVVPTLDEYHYQTLPSGLIAQWNPYSGRWTYSDGSASTGGTAPVDWWAMQGASTVSDEYTPAPTATPSMDYYRNLYGGSYGGYDKTDLWYTGYDDRPESTFYDDQYWRDRYGGYSGYRDDYYSRYAPTGPYGSRLPPSGGTTTGTGGTTRPPPPTLSPSPPSLWDLWEQRTRPTFDFNQYAPPSFSEFMSMVPGGGFGFTGGAGTNYQGSRVDWLSAAGGGGRLPAGGGGCTCEGITINIEGSVVTENELVDVIVARLEERNLRNGFGP